MDAAVFSLDHGTDVYVVRSCHNEDGAGLLAIGGEHSVEIYQMNTTPPKILATFHIGNRITALAWSPQSVSPSRSDDWLVEISAAGIDFGLHLLSMSSSSTEQIFSFGGGLSGHHGKVNDMCFCGGRDEDNGRYVATVSDDKMLMVWDLNPTLDISSGIVSPVRLGGDDSSETTDTRPQPTAYAIAFPHPLVTVNSHPSSSKEFLVSDCRGSVFLVDWRTDPGQTEQGSWRHSIVLELIESRAISDSLMATPFRGGAFTAWRRDSADIIGVSCGARFAIWDLSKLRGGRPLHTGPSFPDGGHLFRWCPTNPDYFAISAHSCTRGAVIHVHNVGYVQTQPIVINVASRPHYIRDFDFIALGSQPVLAAAFGPQVVIFALGDD
ncbi:hypothetical protein ID866_6835 [Astraeus odoratus]|nr:hypothetical protein ID866_6835 [Astraeus odoratus]